MDQAQGKQQVGIFWPDMYLKSQSLAWGFIEYIIDWNGPLRIVESKSFGEANLDPSF